MDTRVGKFGVLRPLGHSLVKVSELCAWSEAEQLPYDFQQIIGEFQFVQAEFLFCIVSDWSTQHLTPEAAQDIMAKRGTTMGGHLFADDPSTAMWCVEAGAQNAFERLLYEAVMNGKLRLLDGITRMPIKGLPAESLARFAELGGNAGPPGAPEKDGQATPQDGSQDCITWQEQARNIAEEIDGADRKAGAHDSVKSIADRVAVLMREREIFGPRGPLSGNTILRNALQGGQWKRNP